MGGPGWDDGAAPGGPGHWDGRRGSAAWLLPSQQVNSGQWALPDGWGLVQGQDFKQPVRSLKTRAERSQASSDRQGPGVAPLCWGGSGGQRLLWTIFPTVFVLLGWFVC